MLVSGMTVAELVAYVEKQTPEAGINYNDGAVVTLVDGILRVELQPDPVDGLPLVKLADRLGDILGLAVQPSYEPVALHYSYQRGYESVRYGQHGNAHFAGAYHPNAVCEGGGVCTWCGRTLVFG
jgi:hypothetical protein